MFYVCVGNCRATRTPPKSENPNFNLQKFFSFFSQKNFFYDSEILGRGRLGNKLGQVNTRKFRKQADDDQLLNGGDLMASLQAAHHSANSGMIMLLFITQQFLSLKLQQTTTLLIIINNVK